jgi:uncharacterized C2H2 Zn-finger protein
MAEKREPFECPACGVSFSSKNELKEHGEKEHGEKHGKMRKK